MEKITNIDRKPIKKALNGLNSHIHEKKTWIDTENESEKLVLENFFNSDYHYVARKFTTEPNEADGFIFQRYEELEEFMDGGKLYAGERGLYFRRSMAESEIYEIRRITMEGEAYMESEGYDTHMDIIDTLWKSEKMTELPRFSEAAKRIRQYLFQSPDSPGIIYSNTPDTHEIIESRATKDSYGRYTVDGRNVRVRGSYFYGDDGYLVDEFIHSLFSGKAVAVRAVGKEKYFLMREYRQISRLWEMAGSVEVRDQDGDLILVCGKERYVVRVITESGQLFLDTQKPWEGLLKELWRNETYTKRIYQEM